MRKSVIRVDLHHAGEKIADFRRRAVSQQRYPSMVPHQRMSRIDTKRLTQKDQCVIVPIHQIVCRGELNGGLRIVGQRPRLLQSLDVLLDTMGIGCPDPVRLV